MPINSIQSKVVQDYIEFVNDFENELQQITSGFSPKDITINYKIQKIKVEIIIQKKGWSKEALETNFDLESGKKSKLAPVHNVYILSKDNVVEWAVNKKFPSKNGKNKIEVSIPFAEGEHEYFRLHFFYKNKEYQRYKKENDVKETEVK